MRYIQSLAILFLLLVAPGAAAHYGQDKASSDDLKPAAQPAKPKPPIPLPADLTSFFSGEWEGVGAFANGREIKAAVKFSPELDNQWFLYSHRDHAPNKYKALGMWGFERLRKSS